MHLPILRPVRANKANIVSYDFFELFILIHFPAVVIPVYKTHSKQLQIFLSWLSFSYHSELVHELLWSIKLKLKITYLKLCINFIGYWEADRKFLENLFPGLTSVLSCLWLMDPCVQYYSEMVNQLTSCSFLYLSGRKLVHHL